MSENEFLNLISKAKELEPEFEKIKDPEYIAKRGYDSKTGYLISNMLIAVENIRRETGYHEWQIMSVKEPTEKMRKELVFIAAVCEELLREE